MTLCPYCQTPFERVAHATRGTIAICLNCAEVSLFDDSLTLHPPPPGHLPTLYKLIPRMKPVIEEAQEAIRIFHMRRDIYGDLAVAKDNQ